jgi:flagellar M-ring protein FliF
MATLDSMQSNRVVGTLARLTPLQKIALGAAVLTLVAGAVVLSRAGSSQAMSPVFSDLEPRDAAAVTDELMSRGVPYELADGGRTVMVPNEEVYDLRIALSGEGLPNSSEGYSLLDNQGLTTSEFRQRIDYQRALEGELAQTLRAIDGIESATVHLALPEESLFVDEPTQPTASVLVRTSDPAAISSDQVSAMVHLVASSIKGMTPENVTIADASGAVLTTGGQPGAGLTGGTGRSDATATFEQEMTASLRSMIARVTGADNVAVTVTADLDLTQRQATSETFDNTEEGGVVSAERTATETYTGTGGALAGATGVLGPDGATVQAPVGGTGEGTFESDDAERTFAVNRTVEQTVQAPGQVERLNVAVLVDAASVTEEQRATIEEMVATAAGVDVERGDQVVVSRLDFDTSAAEAATAAADVTAAEVSAQARNSMIRTGIIGFLVLIAMLLAYRSARRARREVSTPIDIGAIRAAQLGDPNSTAVLPATQAPALSRVTVASESALEELSAMADRRPEEVAQILQTWLADEKGSA